MTDFLQNIKNNEYSFEIIRTKPFLIFKIENFLSDEEYNLVYNSFPTINFDKEINKSQLQKDHLKFSFNSKNLDDIYNDKIKSSLGMQYLHERIINEIFVCYFYKKLKKSYFMSRVDDLKYFIKLLRPKRYKRYNRNFYSKIFTDIWPSIEYSYCYNGAKLVPHTDSRQKLLSLMLYFPVKNLFTKDIEKLGTTFYISGGKNFQNIHLNNPDDEKDFKYRNTEKITLPFNSKTLYGFVRNSKSWHTVEPFNLDIKNFVRKSININLYI